MSTSENISDVDAMFYSDWEIAREKAQGDERDQQLASTMAEELLIYPNLPLEIRASCHLLLSNGESHFVYHARQAYRAYDRLAYLEPGNPQWDDLAELASWLVFELLTQQREGKRLDYGIFEPLETESDEYIAEATLTTESQEDSDDSDSDDDDFLSEEELDDEEMVDVDVQDEDMRDGNYADEDELYCA
ncbi:hypothetical protein EJ08DRAFT_656520 [Tothia fuscella]|uniref:Uncharacterized protein n=1 Tax=Tothia fuscella TaxID=1048955 RepID=A0A9P4P1G2_9PEZI|nr:hypothetical protein EJ08DRAFT_656520 [Tothia fuscella]